MIKHLIFDFGGVFLDLGGKNGKIHYNLEKVFDISEEKALELWKEHKEKLIVGSETPEEFLMRVGVVLGHPINVVEAHELWRQVNKMEKGSIDWDLVSYVESLKKNYKIHMLSNAIDLDASNAEWEHLIHKQFDNIYKSFGIGHKKPNKEAYLHVLEKINAKPEECVFIDDLQVNINAANELGIKGILYTNLNQLKEDFETLKIQLVFNVARVIVLNSEEKILILKRNLQDKWYPGLWDTPGGVDEGETLKDAAIREVREECGLEIEIPEDYFTVFHRTDAPIDIYGFLGGATKGDVVLSSEHTEFAWMTKDYTVQYTDVIAYNKPSLKYSLHCGYKREGIRRKHVFKKGEYWDLIELGLFREEWLPIWKRYKKTGKVR